MDATEEKLLNAYNVSPEDDFRHEKTQPPYETERAKANAMKMQALGQLSAEVAHQLNNMLAAMSTNAEMLVSVIADPAHRQEIAAISQACKNAVGLVRKIQKFCRPQRTDVMMVDLNVVAKDVISFLHGTAGTRIKFDAHLEEGIPIIFGDSNEVYQIILNLLVNAIESLPITSFKGIIKIQTKRVSFSEDDMDFQNGNGRAGDFVLLSVTDNGKGIQPSIIGDIFNPFFTTKGKKGTGLGLKIVKDTIAKSNGWIGVKSLPGIGTTFQVFLPVVNRPKLND